MSTGLVFEVQGLVALRHIPATRDQAPVLCTSRWILNHQAEVQLSLLLMAVDQGAFKLFELTY